MLGIRRDVREQGDVVAGPHLPQQRLEGGLEGRPGLARPANALPYRWWIALAQHLLGQVFGFLHIRLIEHVDPENGAGHRDRILPAKELGAQRRLVLQLERHHGMAGRSQPI